MIPNALLPRNIWVGRYGKVPYDARTGRKASCIDASTWTDYRTAERAMWRFGFDGLSVALGDGLVGIDMDGCFDYQLSPLAADVVARLQSYTEFSMSGTGIHILLLGTVPASRRRKELELYGASRFLAITGRKIQNAPFDVLSRQAELDTLYRELFPEQVHRQVSRGRNLPDDKVLQLAGQSTSFITLYYDGDLTSFDGDWSRGDMALLHTLRRSGASPDQADRLFRDSALMREKWLQPYYRTRTLDRAFGRV